MFGKVNKTTGAVSEIAGLGELVPSVSLYQKGRVTATDISAGGYVTKDISFANAMPDTDYIVVINNASNGYMSVDIVNKTTSGFTAFIYNRATSVIDTGTFDWRAFKLMTDQQTALDEAQIVKNKNNTAPTFSTSTSYAVGSYCIYDGNLYCCTVAHSGAWNDSHFLATNVGLELEKDWTSVTRFSSVAALNSFLQTMPAVSKANFSVGATMTLAGASFPAYSYWTVYKDTSGTAGFCGIGKDYNGESVYFLKASQENNGSISNASIITNSGRIGKDAGDLFNDSFKVALQESINNTQNYSIIQGHTMNGEEGSWYGFRHGDENHVCLTIWSRQNIVSYIKYDGPGKYTYLN